MTDTAPAPVASLGVLAVEGPDAVTFLQGQATCDARQVSPARGALGALCNLQGRMIVSFYVLPAAGGLWLVMPRDRVVPVLNHLKKYAVFSKVTLRDATELAVVTAPAAGEPFAVETVANATLLALRGGRRVGVMPAGEVAGCADASTAWRVGAIAAGELLVDGASADKFLPQALNYDVIEGVSFRKGCYTGQEVVARMHFKGKMKERLYVGSAPVTAAPPAGTAVVDIEGRAVGDVVDSIVSDGRALVGAVIRHEAVVAGNLHLGDVAGAPLVAGAQPYPVPDAVETAR